MPKNYKRINRDVLRYRAERYNENVADLYLHASNDYGAAWENRPESIRKNQLNKVKSGTYDFDKAIKMQRYRVDDAWKAFKKEDREGWRSMTVADKNEVATLLAEDFYDEIGGELADDVSAETGKKFNYDDTAKIIKHYQDKRKNKVKKAVSKSKPFKMPKAKTKKGGASGSLGFKLKKR
tara:strand:- start:2213 stop:2752 length:540 start_codon:yes stop_codon:yes gene_type:complete